MSNKVLTGDTRKIFVSKTVDESHSARVLIGCKPINKVLSSESLYRVQLRLGSTS